MQWQGSHTGVFVLAVRVRVCHCQLYIAPLGDSLVAAVNVGPVWLLASAGLFTSFGCGLACWLPEARVQKTADAFLENAAHYWYLVYGFCLQSQQMRFGCLAWRERPQAGS